MRLFSNIDNKLSVGMRFFLIVIAGVLHVSCQAGSGSHDHGSELDKGDPLEQHAAELERFDDTFKKHIVDWLLLGDKKLEHSIKPKVELKGLRALIQFQPYQEVKNYENNIFALKSLSFIKSTHLSQVEIDAESAIKFLVIEDFSLSNINLSGIYEIVVNSAAAIETEGLGLSDLNASSSFLISPDYSYPSPYSAEQNENLGIYQVPKEPNGCQTESCYISVIDLLEKLSSNTSDSETNELLAGWNEYQMEDMVVNHPDASMEEAPVFYPDASMAEEPVSSPIPTPSNFERSANMTCEELACESIGQVCASTSLGTFECAACQEGYEPGFNGSCVPIEEEEYIACESDSAQIAACTLDGGFWSTFSCQCLTENGGEVINSGCTDPNASNFMPYAITEDGSCRYDGVNGEEAMEDRCRVYTAYNIECPHPANLAYCTELGGTYNYDTQECSVPWPVEGCTDPAADNFDSEATIDDGRCTYLERDRQLCEEQGGTWDELFGFCIESADENIDSGSNDVSDEEISEEESSNIDTDLEFKNKISKEACERGYWYTWWALPNEFGLSGCHNICFATIMASSGFACDSPADATEVLEAANRSYLEDIEMQLSELTDIFEYHDDLLIDESVANEIKLELNIVSKKVEEMHEGDLGSNCGPENLSASLTVAAEMLRSDSKSDEDVVAYFRSLGALNEDCNNALETLSE